MKDFGPYEDFSSAIQAWLYYTPARKYELSLLTDMAAPGSELYGQASCRLPLAVDDPRYPPESLQHIFILHNHPFAGEISRPDIYFAADMARAHALVADAGGRKIPLSIIAFFSESKDGDSPTCDGFYQYVPATSELLQWGRHAGGWRKKHLGAVNWSRDGAFSIERAPRPAR